MQNLTVQSDLEVVEPDVVCVGCGAPCTDEDEVQQDPPVYRCGMCVVKLAASMIG